MLASDWIVLFLEIVGTIAFASSGALVGIRKDMDIFGINVLGITTAIGGGIIRDLILGIHPPKTFQNPLYIIVAIVTSCVLFLVVYFKQKILESKWMTLYDQMMLVMDTLGLAIFTVLGINAALHSDVKLTGFLLIFVGVVTGIGGGMMRDVMAGLMPFVFIKHIYACASLVGAVTCVLMLKYGCTETLSMIAGAVLVIIIRFLAARYRWNLPRIRLTKKYEFKN